MRIVIAEDEDVTRRLLERALTQAGHEVVSTADGEAAFAAWSEAPAPIVITDWMMPRMSGVELCRRIRETPGVPYTHILVVTTLSPGEHTLEAFRAGADDFVGKPYSPQDVLARVDAATRSMLRQEETAARHALETCQRLLGPNDAAVGEAIGALVDVLRRQRAFVRCRAFLRRQIDVLSQGGTLSDPRIESLRADLAELATQKEGD